MTERLYYTDSYTTQFQAKVIERSRLENGLALVLDRTYFYPTSGGQMADYGFINGEPVRDVYVREPDEAIVHVLDNQDWHANVRW